MSSTIERCRIWLAAVAVIAVSTGPLPARAQIGEVLDEELEEDHSDDTADERQSAMDRRFDERSEGDDEVDEADAESAELDDANHSALPYRVGADNHLEVGGHLLTSFFTSPELPDLGVGLGFQGRLAFDLIASIVAEGSVGVMFNGQRGSESSVTTAFLRAGGRYPIDLHAKPVLFFVGAGVALNFFGTSTITVTGEELSRSAIAPAFDLQLGMIYDLHERIAIELIAQGNYALSNEVFLRKDASWISIFVGASYDL